MDADSGCAFVRQTQSGPNQQAAVKWRQRLAKYPNWRHEKRQLMLMLWGAQELRPMFGKNRGARRRLIDVNGSGSLLTTEECLLSQAAAIRG